MIIEPYIDDRLKVSGAEAEVRKRVFISMHMRDKEIEDYELYRGCNMELQAFQRFLAPAGVKGYAEQRSNDEARVLVLHNIKE